MLRSATAALLIGSSLLASCTSIDFKDLKPLEPSASGGCKAQERASLGLTSPPTFTFALPGALEAQSERARLAGAPVPPPTADFNEYVAQVSQMADGLPDDIRESKVAKSFKLLLLTSAAKAQIAAQREISTREFYGDQAESERRKLDHAQAQVDAVKVDVKVSHGELKQFVRALLGHELQPQISAVELERATLTDSPSDAARLALKKYFSAYYGGTFVDRFGAKIAKRSLYKTDSSAPYLTVTVTDADIAAAETVLLEYLADLYDPTPEFGDVPDVAKATKFWPGGTAASKPTILSTGLAKYSAMPTNSCGISPDNLQLAVKVAAAAGDRAALLGGLVNNSFGGISAGFGIFGKVSIGDNQTLSVVVKTFAQRAATRAVYAWAYQILNSIGDPRARGIDQSGDDARLLSFPTGNNKQ